MAVPKFGNYEWIPGHLEGKDVFIVASGPSAKPIIESGKLDDKLKIVISHTSNFVRMNDDDFLHFLDPPVMQKLTQNFQEMNYRTIVGRNINLEPGGKITRIQYSNQPNLDPRHGFYGARSTGHFSLNIALSMRAKNIYMIGFDCTAKGNDVNFYNTQQVKGYRRGGGERYETMIAGFEKFKQFDNVYNLSPVSLIKVFPKVNWDDVL